MYPTKTFDASVVSEKPLLEMSDLRIRPMGKKRSRRIETRSVGKAHATIYAFKAKGRLKSVFQYM